MDWNAWYENLEYMIYLTGFGLTMTSLCPPGEVYIEDRIYRFIARFAWLQRLF